MPQPQLTFAFEKMPSDERLGELIIYIAAKCGDDPNFGATKLNKILYFADFLSYMYDGKPITGAEYMRLSQGPVPKHLVPVREKLRASCEIGISIQPRLGKNQHRIIAQRPPNIDIFTSREIALVDEVIESFWGKTARRVSAMSHGIAWKIAKDRESIPYQAAYLSDDRPTPEDVYHAQELIKDYGWQV